MEAETMVSSDKPIVLIAGTAHPEFAQKVSAELGVKLLNVTHYNFADGEVGFRLEKKVYVEQMSSLFSPHANL